MPRRLTRCRWWSRAALDHETAGHAHRLGRRDRRGGRGRRRRELVDTARRWTDGLIQVFVGGVCAYYLSPIAIPALTPVLGNIVATSEQLERLSGFVIGLGGVSVSGFVTDLWTQRRALLDARKETNGDA